MFTQELIAQIQPAASRRKRSYPIAKVFGNGSVSIRIAPKTWTEPLQALPVPLFQLLPIGQQRVVAERATGVRKGLIYFT